MYTIVCIMFTINIMVLLDNYEDKNKTINEFH